MDFPQIFNVVLGLTLFYFILSLPVSLVSQMISESFEIRGVTLQKYLRAIAGDKVEDLINLPEIKSLRPIRYKNVYSFISGATEPKMLENVPVPILVDAFFELIGLASKKNPSVLELRKKINNMPEGEAKKTFIHWVNQGVISLDELRTKANIYFSGLMEQAKATANNMSRSFVILLSIQMVLLFGTDSIELAKYFSIDQEFQKSVALVKIEAILQERGANIEMTDLLEEVSMPNIVIGWWQTELPTSNNNLIEWSYFIILKVLGLALTAVAISPGAGFWYDIFNKIK